MHEARRVHVERNQILDIRTKVTPYLPCIGAWGGNGWGGGNVQFPTP